LTKAGVTNERNSGSVEPSERKKRMPDVMMRQGDVLVRAVSRIPEGLKAVPLDKGRVILAYGEVTGHAHAIVGEGVEFLAADIVDLNNRFLRIDVELAGLVDAWECKNWGGETVYLAGYQPREHVESAGFTIVGRSMVQGVVVEHEEHLHQVVTPGDYEVMRQREFQDEAPAYVAD
jgi:hypothetical protein